ncbi:MAG: FRG domain-containing protein [Lachnospiraceae bacterium]|nr:FRG domain-containing protein [Lachnospiraceae bacterium]
MNTYVVKSLAEYINLIEKIGSNDTEKWYRGQSKCEYRLSPSALRKVIAIEDQRGNKLDTPVLDNTCSGSNNLVAFLPVDKMVDEFSKKAAGCLEYDVKSNIEWECIAQHYGIPTRVLDWTTNAMNALFFAVGDCLIGKTEEDDIEYFIESEGFGSGGGAVFVIDPLEINKLSAPIKDFEENPKILDAIEDSKLLEECLHSMIPPVCFSGFNKEKRISRQAGKFTTTGTLLWPMDYYNVLQKKITKIFIPYSAFESIRHQLSALGITHNTIYVEDDEKDVLAKEIAEETKKKFDDLFSLEH